MDERRELTRDRATPILGAVLLSLVFLFKDGKFETGRASACAVAVVGPTATALAPCSLDGLGRSRTPAVPGSGSILGQPTGFLL